MDELALGFDLLNDVAIEEWVFPRHLSTDEALINTRINLARLAVSEDTRDKIRAAMGPNYDRIEHTAHDLSTIAGTQASLDQLQQHLHEAEAAGVTPERKLELANKAKQIVKSIVRPGIRFGLNQSQLHITKINKRNELLKRGTIDAKSQIELDKLQKWHPLHQQNLDDLQALHGRYAALAKITGVESRGERFRAGALDSANAAFRFVSRHRVPVMGLLGIAMLAATIESFVSQKKSSK